MFKDLMVSEADNSKQGAEKAGGVFKSTLVVGSMTLLSRVLGLARDMVYARFFGAGLVMDAFFVAFKIPNIFRRFFAEGAFSQAFVPVFAEYEDQRSHEELQSLANNVAGTLGIILFVFTALGVIASPILISMFGMGWLFSPAPDSADKFALSADMLRFTFPYLFFISLTALAGGILNTYKKFAAPAFAPVLLNVVLIGFSIYVAPYSSNPGIVLAVGVFVAGLAQLLFMLPFLRGIQLLGMPRWGWHDPGVRRIVKLMAPALFGSSVAQISILFDTMIATFLITGSVSWLYFSDRLMEFPLGVFGIALATVVLPNLSRHFSGDSMDEFSHTLDWALRLVAVISTPAAVGLFVLAGPAIATIFYGRLFDIEAVEMARMSLMAYSFGLVGFTLVKILVPGYFSRQDAKTPVKVGLVALAANLVLNLILVSLWLENDFPGPHTALAVATALSALLNAFLLFRGLRSAGVLHLLPGWRRLLLRLLLANALMAMLLLEFAPPLSEWYEVSAATRAWWLGVLVLGGAVAYLAALFAIGLRISDLRIKSSNHSL
ncbi:MAG: murein biosynthesis integral membrane protein MurJ [Gammaproteobacteria bacterium]|nr:murein biosynthesis integral membrane protein MurJ [Gammaproteobacteria bacterium]